MIDPSSLVCAGDRGSVDGKGGKETIHRLNVREFHDAKRANLRGKKNQEGKMFCFDLYRRPFLQSPPDQLRSVIPL